MSHSPRPERVADAIQVELADIMSRRLKDPRHGFLTVTAVEVTPDLGLARIFISALTEGELGDLLGFVDLAKAEGDTVEHGIGVALRAVLVSPNFVFRVELDPEPTDTTPHPLSDYELASRLSYFLWSSMPDDELFAAAEAGQLSDPEELEKQVRRMLDDDKAGALVENFGGQWLPVKLNDKLPDANGLFAR